MPPPAIMPGRAAPGRLCQRSITAGTHWISVGARFRSASSSGRSPARSPSRSNSAPAMPARALRRAQRAQDHRVGIDLGLRADLEPPGEALEGIGVRARNDRREVHVGLLQRQMEKIPA